MALIWRMAVGFALSSLVHFRRPKPRKEDIGDTLMEQDKIEFIVSYDDVTVSVNGVDVARWTNETQDYGAAQVCLLLQYLGYDPQSIKYTEAY